MRVLSAPVSAAIALFVAACGDPAPGHGVDKPHEQTTMPEIVSAAEAIGTPDIPAIDLQSMDEAEYEKVIPEGPGCSFAYSRASKPVLASNIGEEGAIGVVKIHGRLVETRGRNVASLDALSRGATFTAGGLSVQVTPDPDEPFERREGKMQREADAIFKLEQGLKVGYRGWYVCEPARSEPQETSQ